MAKRKASGKQSDLFAHNPKRMQWQNLPQATRQSTQQLLAELLLQLSAHCLTTETKACLQQSRKERHHASED